MKNIIILGSGRSGTSMLAGLFSNSGYFMGDNLWPPTDSNPKGFFEDREINEINEDLLELITPKRPILFGYSFLRRRPVKWQRWLTNLPIEKEIKTNSTLNLRMEKITKNKPFCFKDPRFSYTLPAWEAYLEDTIFLCIFRNPAISAASMLKESRVSKTLNQGSKAIKINLNDAIGIWNSMYSHILKNRKSHNNWYFIHYDQVFDKNLQKKLEYISGANIDYDFPEKTLSRTIAIDDIPNKSLLIYKELCSLANYNID